MKKNIVFIPYIDMGDGRSSSYAYSIKSWEKFCERHNAEIIVWQDLIVPVEEMKITWQRYYLFDMLENSGIDYDKVLMVDADTIVHPECPNFFDKVDGYGVVRNNGSFEWVRRSVAGFANLMFDGYSKWNVWDYVNCGFQVVNSDHKNFFKYVLDFYKNNSEKIIDSIERVKAGTDQTIMNFLFREYGVNLQYFGEEYNLQDLHSKQLLYLQDGMWFPDELIYKECGYVFHFNAIPPNPLGRDSSYWIKRTYEEWYK